MRPLSEQSIAGMRLLWRSFLLIGTAVFGIGLWTYMASIPTTIRVNGEIFGERSSYEVHSARNGELAQVGVSLFDSVDEGTPLFLIDARDVDSQIEVVKAKLVFLDQEVHEIDRRIGLPSGAKMAANSATVLSPEVVAAFRERDDTQIEAIRRGDIRRSILLKQMLALQNEREIVTDLLEIGFQKLERQMVLSASGHSAVGEVDLARETIMSLRTRLANLASQIQSIEGEVQVIDADNTALIQQYRQSLFDLKARNVRDINVLRENLVQLELARDQSIITSPIEGVVTRLTFESAGQVVSAGDPIAVISEPLEDPQLKLKVGPLYIDQIRVGQIGRVMVSSLPMRKTPNLALEVLAVSSEPQEDPRSGAIYYEAHAKIAEDDVAKLAEEFGDDFRLTVGMPIVAIIEGRKTTFASYLLDPITSIWTGAFES